MRSRTEPTRRQITLFIAGIGILAALIVAVTAPVPYVILSPGPTLNTLGKGPGGHPLIQITGHPSHPGSGHLNMVTVSYVGGPYQPFNVFTALRAWLTPGQAVVPEVELFPPGKTQRQVVQIDAAQMAGSQETATAAALCQLGIHFTTLDTVQTVIKGMPAAGVLRTGDVITAVDGAPVTCRADLGTLIRSHPPGSTLVLTVDRAGTARQLRLKTVRYQGHSVVGIDVFQSYRFPFQVKISVGPIGGPSAGMMFALGIIDKLTGQNLADGRFVAGTGEISPNGAVSPIGGIQQKMAGARAAGATIFLAPAQNCPDTAGAIPAGLRVVKVSTLAGAIADLKAIAAGRPVPAC